MPYVRTIRRRQNRIRPVFNHPRNIPGRRPVVRRADGTYESIGAMSFRVRGRPGVSSFDRYYYVIRR